MTERKPLEHRWQAVAAGLVEIAAHRMQLWQHGCRLLPHEVPPPVSIHIEHMKFDQIRGASDT